MRSNKPSISFEILRDDEQPELLYIRVSCKPKYFQKRLGEILSGPLEDQYVPYNGGVIVPFEDYGKLLETLRTNNFEEYTFNPINNSYLTFFQEKYMKNTTKKVEIGDGVSKKIKQCMYPFQRESVMKALRNNGNIILAQEMGTGKTICSLAIASHYARDGMTDLVICPSYLRANWNNEIYTWEVCTDPDDVQIVMKTSDDVLQTQHRFVVISYDLAVRKAKDIEQLNINSVIVDESHYLKNRNSKRTSVLTPIINRAQHRILLSGTPTPSRTEELFSQVHLVDPGTFSDYFNFVYRYCNAHKGHFGLNVTGKSNTTELNIMLQDIMVRVLKKDVLSDLPEKIRQRLVVQPSVRDLKEIRTLFEQMQKLKDVLKTVHRYDVEEDKVPYHLKKKHFEFKALVTEMKRATCRAKMQSVLDVVEDRVKNYPDKFIIFAHHNVMLDAIEKLVNKLKTGYIRIDGKTDQRKRQDLVDSFRNVDNKQYKVAILGISAANTGLNFVPVQTMIFAELSWVPSEMLQAEDRIHRIKAESKSVLYQYIIANDTYDQRMFENLVSKNSTVTQLIDNKKTGDLCGMNTSVFESSGLPLTPEQLGLNNFVELLSHHFEEEYYDHDTFIKNCCIPVSADFVKKNVLTTDEQHSVYDADNLLNSDGMAEFLNLSEYTGSTHCHIDAADGLYLLTELTSECIRRIRSAGDTEKQLLRENPNVMVCYSKKSKKRIKLGS